MRSTSTWMPSALTATATGTRHSATGLYMAKRKVWSDKEASTEDRDDRKCERAAQGLELEIGELIQVDHTRSVRRSDGTTVRRLHWDGGWVSLEWEGHKAGGKERTKLAFELVAPEVLIPAPRESWTSTETCRFTSRSRTSPRLT